MVELKLRKRQVTKELIDKVKASGGVVTAYCEKGRFIYKLRFETCLIK